MRPPLAPFVGPALMAVAFALALRAGRVVEAAVIAAIGLPSAALALGWLYVWRRNRRSD